MINTINDVINFIEKEPNNPTAFNYKDYSGTWQAVSTQQFIHEVRCIVAALQKIGLRKGIKSPSLVQYPISGRFAISALCLPGALQFRFSKYCVDENRYGNKITAITKKQEQFHHHVIAVYLQRKQYRGLQLMQEG